MLRKTRGPRRSPGFAGPVLLCALVAAGCGAPPRRTDSQARPLDPGVFVEYTKVLHEYLAALKLLGSDDPAAWAEGKRKLESLNFAYFNDDRLLIDKFRAGEELARRELARRGKMLECVLVFTSPYAPATWEHARKEMLSLGEGAPEFLTISLLKILLNGRFYRVWPQIRYQLVAIGDVAFETTSELTKQLVASTPETPIWKQEDLVQLLMVLVGFGERGRAILTEAAKHKVWNVRKAVARAIGESVDLNSADILVRYLEGDPEWQVKATAAEAIGRLRPSRQTLGPVLADRMKKERDGFVMREIVKALGAIRWLGGIPELMRVLEVPNYETVLVAMESLYFLTGERRTTVGQWKEWYRDTYPKWILEQTP